MTGRAASGENLLPTNEVSAALLVAQLCWNT